MRGEVRQLTSQVNKEVVHSQLTSNVKKDVEHRQLTSKQLKKEDLQLKTQQVTSKEGIEWTHLHPLYKHKEVDTNVFFIQERYFESSWNQANIFLIRGSSRDLLIDTGIGVYNLAKFLTSSGLRPDPDKPLDVVLTHVHFDHSGGAYQFPCENVYIHPLEQEFLKSGDRYMTVSWITDKEITPRPPLWDSTKYRVQPCQAQLVNEGDKFYLGDKTVEVFHLPGHTAGSLGLYDRTNGVLATGDTLYQTDFGLIDWYPGSCDRHMAASVERLACLSGDVSTVLPGHNGVLDRAGLQEAAEKYLENCHDMTRRVTKGVTRKWTSFSMGIKSRTS